MANAFQHFAQGIGHLTDEANGLKNEQASIEQRIALLDQRRKEIIVRIVNIEQESFDIAKAYTSIHSASAGAPPRSTSNAARPPDQSSLEEVKPIILIEDETEAIAVASRATSDSQTMPVHGPVEKIGIDNRFQTSSFLNENYPTVILLDDKWTEIWCSRCGANSSTRSSNGFRGSTGLYVHWSQAHKGEPDMSTKACLTRCGRRILGDDEVEQVKNGTRAPLDLRRGKNAIGNLSAIATPATTLLSNMSTPLTNSKGERLSRVVALPVGAAVAKDARQSLPARFHAGLLGTKKRLTEYEMFQNLQAEAKAAGGSKCKKRRTTGAKSKYVSDAAMDVDEED